MGFNAIAYVAWRGVAAAHVQNCGRDPARWRNAQQTARLGIVNRRIDPRLMWVRWIYPKEHKNEVISTEGIV
jgi:hypothetical protein